MAGELLWGALYHLAEALIDHHGLTNSGRRMRRKEVLVYLQSVSPASPSLTTQFDNIAALHGNFYNGHIGRAALNIAFEAGIQFIEYLFNRPELQTIT